MQERKNQDKKVLKALINISQNIETQTHTNFLSLSLSLSLSLWLRWLVGFITSSLTAIVTGMWKPRAFSVSLALLLLPSLFLALVSAQTKRSEWNTLSGICLRICVYKLWLLIFSLLWIWFLINVNWINVSLS
jgi:hypothetical protein